MFFNNLAKSIELIRYSLELTHSEMALKSTNNVCLKLKNHNFVYKKKKISISSAANITVIMYNCIYINEGADLDKTGLYSLLMAKFSRRLHPSLL